MFSFSPTLNDLYPFCEQIDHQDSGTFAELFVIALLGGLLRGRGWRRFAPVMILAGLSLPMLTLGIDAVRHYEAKISQRDMVARMQQAAPEAYVYVVTNLPTSRRYGSIWGAMSRSLIATMLICIPG